MKKNLAGFVLSMLLSPWLVGSVFFARSASAEDAPLAASLFQDHMVVQRDEPIPIWGTSTSPGDLVPGSTVTVEMAGQRVGTRAHSTGWDAVLPALPAGGPYELTITTSGGASQKLTDVLVGDVFLCSGQSNMEMTVSRALDSWSEVNSAGASGGDSRIRMTKIGRAATVQPRSSFPVPLVWESPTPETVGDWSAVCYFFARELQKSVDVPLGLIDASWGGSDVRAWMRDVSLAEVGGYSQALAQLRDYAKDEQLAQRRFGENWQSWWREVADDEPWQPAAGADWPPAPDELGNWKAWGMPELESFDGMVWFRSTFELTAERAAQNATLVLGGVDEVDQTWLNGEIVGNTFGWGDVRRYEISADWLHAGENVVVANIFSAWDAGGLVAGGLNGDSPREMRLVDGTAVPLEGWRYERVESPKEPPRAPWESIAGRTTLYNAMIAPLRHLELRGALWYQGESNTAQGLDYAPLLSSMIHGWRRQFSRDLPFLVVQLAGFGSRDSEPRESGLANVREAQRLVARDDPKTAIVTAVDVGDVYDVHPPNKQEVGRRLARAARHLIYGEDVTPSGPLPARAVRGGDSIRVEFEDVVGGLRAFGHERPIGFQMCGDEPGTCRWADARIDGESVVLEEAVLEEAALEEAVDSTRVRYCWGDSPVCTLYDGAELPAIPFELPIETKSP